MSIFAFPKKPARQVGLVLDIGSKTVGGAIFEKDTDGNASLLYSAREPITFQKVITGERLLPAMLRSLELVLVHLEKYGVEHLRHASAFSYYVGSVSGVISSPWHVSETKKLKLSQEKFFTITEGLVDSLLAEEEKDFTKALSEGEHRETNLDFLEHKIIEIKLNGYATANPYGKKAKQLDLSLFTSLAPRHILQKIRTLILKYFSVQRIEFHTFSLAAFASIRDFFPRSEHFFIVQIGGEVTDITIVKNGIIAEAVSFPLGCNHLLRSLDAICGNHPRCSLESLIALHREAKINPVDKKKVDRAIAEARASWSELFNGAIADFSSEVFLPSAVFLFEDGQLAPIFEEFFKDIGSGRFTITSEPFILRTAAELGKVFSGSALSADPVLLMEANFDARF